MHRARGQDPPRADQRSSSGGRMTSQLLAQLAIFVISAFLGFELISRVPNLLHTPLMSATNAIHGIVLVGAIIALASASDGFTATVGLIAVVFGAMNVVGGFWVTTRMLGMFGPPKKRVKKREEWPLQVAPFLAYLAAAALFIYGIRRLRTPETARSGNTLAAVGMVIALVATIFVADIDRVLGALEIGAGVLVGSMIGAVAAQRVQMTAMPQMVAAFNGVGGAAAALVAVSEFYRVEALGVVQETLVSAITVLLSVIIGTISFSGSIIAFVKLQELALGGSVTFPLQQVVNALIALSILLLSANIVADGAILPFLSPLASLYVILGAALLLGVLFVIPIGGAGMSIVISLLNAFTGLAAAASGFVLSNYALIISGTLVGASGTILTRLMSGALGRPLGKIIFAGIAASGTSSGGQQQDREVNDASASEVGEYLADDAEKVIVVPGYGLAVAQAQQAMRDLVETLESEGKEVLFGIHPVAGRMPGHMNVLLTEVGIPYEKLYDLEDINPEFEETDAAIIVGANDVVNPAANDPEQDSPISGMPILNVEAADRVIFIKRSLSPGFAGVDNPLFYDTEKTMMLFSDAKQGLQDLNEAVKNG